MFDKFGEFDSAEEINKKAQKELEKGDIDIVFALAEENGIDKEDAQDYAEGCVETLTTVRTAALGKLEIEASDLELAGITLDWKNIIIEECMNSEQMAEAVRRKGKSLKDCMAKLISFAFENKVQISNKIVDVTKVKYNGKEVLMRKPLYLGVPNKAETRKIITDYYLK